jgi:hypothetical protein
MKKLNLIIFTLVMVISNIQAQTGDSGTLDITFRSSEPLVPEHSYL